MIMNPSRLENNWLNKYPSESSFTNFSQKLDHQWILFTKLLAIRERIKFTLIKIYLGLIF